MKRNDSRLVVLVVPLGTDDVIVHAAAWPQPIVQPQEQVGVINAQRFAGPHGQGGVDAGSPGQKRRHVIGRVIVDAAAKAIVQLKGDWPVQAGLELNFRGMANKLFDCSSGC